MGAVCRGSMRSGRAPLCACVRPAVAGQVNRAEEEGYFRLAYDVPGQPDVRLSRRIATGGRRVRQEESRGGKTDRSGTGVQKAHSGEKERWPPASGGLERRKERPCGRSRCVQDDAGRLQRLTGDNVRPLMPARPKAGRKRRVAVRKEEHESASGRGVRSQAEAMRIKKAPCSFLQGRNMVGHQGLEPRTN